MTSTTNAVSLPRYLLQARAVEGPLFAVTRNETREVRDDVLDVLVERAWDLAERGYTVWLYDDSAHDPTLMRCLRVIEPVVSKWPR